MTGMASRDLVVRAAQRLKLLTPHGTLQQLDSMSIVDLVVELEGEIGHPIPATALTIEAFESLESVSALVDGLRPQE